jgi:hypothetical protein
VVIIATFAKSETDYNDFDAIGANGNNSFTLLLGMRVRNKDKKSYANHKAVRFGVTYTSGIALSNTLFKEERKPFDTLTSSQTGQQIFVDSVLYSQLGMNYTSQQLRLEGSYIFKTRSYGRWSLFAGLGLSAGVSLQANTEIFFNENKRTESTTSNLTYFPKNGSESEFKTERYRNKSNIGVGAFIPFGVNFQLGNTNDFWKHTSIFYEMRPGVHFTSIPELNTLANANLQQCIGFRFNWQ